MKLRWRSARSTCLSAFVLLFAAASSARANDRGWLLPESISDVGDRIDALWWAIFVLTGIVFVATEGALIWFMIKYRAKEGGKAIYSHGNHKLEVIWTLIPAIILGLVAVVQFGIWTEIKDPEKAPFNESDAIEVHVLAKQFDWHFRYAGADGKWGTKDDYRLSQLVVPENRPVILRIRSIDVIHSLYLPELRFKQDAVPGLTITGWFKARKSGRWEIACAELCGASHYLMRSEYEIVASTDWDARVADYSANNRIDYDSPTEFFRFWRLEPYIEALKEAESGR